MLETCKACRRDFLTEADPYVVKPTTQGYMLYCSCMILGEGQTNEFISADRIAALEQLAEMVIDPRNMPHQHEDLQTRMYCLQERARELMEVKE